MVWCIVALSPRQLSSYVCTAHDEEEQDVEATEANGFNCLLHCECGSGCSKYTSFLKCHVT